MGKDGPGWALLCEDVCGEGGGRGGRIGSDQIGSGGGRVVERMTDEGSSKACGDGVRVEEGEEEQMAADGGGGGRGRRD